jgi:nucleotide-binding universal stress UspA family protein
MKLANAATRISLKNILFATDFSNAAEAALPYALAVARRYGAKLHVAHVLPPDAWQMAPPETRGQTLEENRRIAREQLRLMQESGRFRGVEGDFVFEEGDVWEKLAGILAARDVDLIVVGTRGRSGLQKFLLGSTAEEIFRLAECPVLTVGPSVSVEPDAPADTRHVLYATDFSATADAALPYALSLAQENNAELTLLHVLPDVVKSALADEQVLDQAYLTRLRALVPPDAELWCKPEFAVAFGSPADAILRVAKERNADLIVMGVRKGGSFTRASTHTGRPTASKVAGHAHCPVLTVRD